MQTAISQYRVDRCLAHGGMVLEQNGRFALYRGVDGRNSKVGGIARPVIERSVAAGRAISDTMQRGRYVSAGEVTERIIAQTRLPSLAVRESAEGMMTVYRARARKEPSLEALPAAINHLRTDHHLATAPEARHVRRQQCSSTLAAERLRIMAGGFAPDQFRLVEHVLLSNISAVVIGAILDVPPAEAGDHVDGLIHRYLDRFRQMTRGRL